MKSGLDAMPLFLLDNLLKVKFSKKDLISFEMNEGLSAKFQTILPLACCTPKKRPNDLTWVPSITMFGVFYFYPLAILTDF